MIHPTQTQHACASYRSTFVCLCVVHDDNDDAADDFACRPITDKETMYISLCVLHPVGRGATSFIVRTCSLVCHRPAVMFCMYTVLYIIEHICIYRSTWAVGIGRIAVMSNHNADAELMRPAHITISVLCSFDWFLYCTQHIVIGCTSRKESTVLACICGMYAGKYYVVSRTTE